MNAHSDRSRSASVLVSIAIVLLAPLAVGAGTPLRPFRATAAITSFRTAGSELTFAQRVEYQRRIEGVTWRHTLWPTENGRAKPELDAVMPRSAIVDKVRNTLAKSRALEACFHRPISPEQLQAEIDRMAAGSKQPSVLRDYWIALDNDPYLIAECLARPLLADRLLRSWYASDERIHGATRERAAAALRACPTLVDAKARGARYVETELTTSDSDAGDGLDVSANTLPVGATSALLESDAQFYAVTVLDRTPSTTKVAVASWPKVPFDTWWRETSASVQTATATERASYTLPGSDAVRTDDSWSPTSFMPRPRMGHTSVWTGTEMIAWGGILQYPETGARYNPATDLWHSISTVNEPAPRSGHKAVWTGTEMIVWGGWGGLDVNNLFNTGGRYNPQTDTWTPTSTGANVAAARDQHSAVWTGTAMIVWGGSGVGGGHLGSGARYNPTSDTWTPVTSVNEPEPRAGSTAIWTGSQLIVWGGFGTTTYLNTGGRYDPVSNTWEQTSTSGAPAARTLHSAIWTGTEMIVWGGGSNSLFTRYNDGGRYNPVTNTWTATTTVGAPTPTFGHSAIWTGSRMIVWGGCAPHDCSYQLNTGGLYDPATDSWTPTGTVNAPSPRTNHTAVWTGTEMIVWAGLTGSYVTNTGGRYDPATDTWVPTAVSPTPWNRTLPTAIWTGTEMLVWGVDSELLDKATYRYSPATDVWTKLFSLNAPDARSGHSVVWTGTEMIVWGGGVTGLGESLTGGRFNPMTNVWTETSVTGAPSAREWHSAVWTGTQMIVWGGCLDGACNFYLNTGGRYDPVSDSWTPMNVSSAPSPRNTHTAVWTGSEMVVWGGQPVTNTGGRYNPATDSWSSTSHAGAPSPRWAHTAVWSGTEMIVWGGFDGTNFFQNGGRYVPSTNTWSATATSGAPDARWNHTAVWTGSEMIVWGGIGNATWPYQGLATGGRYTPATDAWSAVTLQRAPSARDAHRAVWTGTGMIVWGGFLDPSGVSTNSGGLYAVGAPGLGTDTPGIDVANTGAWFLKNDNAPGSADMVFGYGPAGSGWIAFDGDWDGNGTVTVGLYDPSSGFFFLRNVNAPGAADLTFGYGPAAVGWQPLAGDWDGNGTDTVGLYDASTGSFFLRNVNAPGPADLTFGYGPAAAGWIALAGDWDGNGIDSIGLYDPSTGFFFLKNVASSGPADLTFGYGSPGATPLTGNWDGL